MRLLTSFATTLALALATPAPATTAFAPAGTAPYPVGAWSYGTTVTKLLAYGSAETLFTATLLPLSPGASMSPARRLQMLDHAAHLVPANRAIAAHALTACTEVAACDVRVYAHRLKAVAPNDAGYLVPKLQAAQQRHDAAAATAVLVHMAALDTLQGGWLATAAMIRRALDQVGARSWVVNKPGMAPALEHRLLARMLASATLPLHFGVIAKGCNPKHAGSAYAARRAACARIGAMLQRADTVAFNLVGLRLEEWAATRDAQRQSIRKRRRRIRWQMHLYSTLLRGDNPLAVARASAPLLHAQQAAGSELGGLAVELERLGQPLEPPPGWHSRGWHLRHDHKVHQRSHQSGVCHKDASNLK